MKRVASKKTGRSTSPGNGIDRSIKTTRSPASTPRSAHSRVDRSVRRASGTGGASEGGVLCYNKTSGHKIHRQTGRRSAIVPRGERELSPVSDAGTPPKDDSNLLRT